MDNLIKKIKQKKELKSLSDDFVQSILENYFEHELLDLPLDKKKETVVVKEIRSVLHEVYGAFKSNKFHKRNELLEKGDYSKLLLLHKSTKERADFYPEIYSKLKTLIPNVKSILDLGCGMNPIAYNYLKWKNVKYYATELTEDDVNFINNFFTKEKIDGEAFVMDLLKIGDLPKVDVCFMFKLLDTLESLERDISKKVLDKVNCKWLVVSFPTFSLGGRKRLPIKRLVWFERLIKDYDYNTFELGGEFFYVIRKV